jgi:SAM-dependent methyltransferase
MERFSQYLEKLKDLRVRGASEDSIRDAFLTFLRQTFPRIEQAEPILLERHIPALRVRGGYADALYGDLVFEFKRQVDAQSRVEGCEELSRYLNNQRRPERYFGILTDGEALEVYSRRGNELAKVDTMSLAATPADQARLWLDCYLFHEKNLQPTANDVALRFGERSATFWHSLRILDQLWRQVGTSPALQTKFTEWESLLSIVYGSAVGDEALFLRHSYLALFARLLGFVAFERRAPAREELPGIVTGATFRAMGLENFVENDFFAWVSEAGSGGEAEALLHSIATRLTAAYDLGAIREDLLKELYQELVDPQTRHDLGEFYTPDWLAEMTLREAGFPPEKGKGAAPPALLDPACGSGTFLFTAVRLLRERGWKGETLVDFCMEHVAGVDVHPLAVTIAKTNLLLALGEDVRAYEGPVTLRVYMADTLSWVDHQTTHPEVAVPVEVDQIAKRSGKEKPRGLPRAFGLPTALAAHADGLHAAVDAVLEFADPNLGEAEAKSGFAQRLANLNIPGNQTHQWEANLDLMRWLLRPPATDSVWRFILKNAYQPQMLAQRKFPFVVGNPPWLAYNRIKRRDYQERVKEQVFAYRLLDKREVHLFTQMELATLFFAFCSDRYLARDGTIAFVMPRSVLTGAKHHRKFQRRYVRACRLLIDCEEVAPLFNVPACDLISARAGVLSARSADDEVRAVPTLHLSGELPSRNASYEEARARLQTTRSEYAPRGTTEASPYLDQMVQGTSLAPRCAWFVTPPAIARTINPRRPYLVTDASTERHAKPPWKGVRIEGSVESDYLFATLLSDNMVPFGWRQLSLVALPLATTETGTGQLLDAGAVIRRGTVGMYGWLRKAEAVWQQHRKAESQLVAYINWQNKLTRQRPSGVMKLLYGKSGTHLCACVVDARQPDDFKVHTLPVRGFIADYVTYRFETKTVAEAHYLCAVLNAPCVDEGIKPFQTKGAFGARSGKGERDIHRRPFEVLPIPRFSNKDDRHKELARTSQRCHRKVAEFFAEADEPRRTARIGPLRTQLRRELLQEELAAIDQIVVDVLARPR